MQCNKLAEFLKCLLFFLNAAERELVEFLTEEIVAERKAQKVKTFPAKIDEFEVKLQGADVELIKKSGNEE